MWVLLQQHSAQSERAAEISAALPVSRKERDQRFENWKLRRALARPYFLRSTVRLSRVRKPARLTGVRRIGSNLVSAWLMPCLTAPAWPDRPPPLTVQITSYWPSRPATPNTWLITRRKV